MDISMTKKSLLFVMLMIFQTPAHGMVYTWSDSSGIRHYVNKEHDIPTRYRARTKPLYPEPSDILEPQQNLQSQNIQPATSTQPQSTKTEETPVGSNCASTPKPRHITKLGINLKKSVGHKKIPESSPEKK